MHNISPCSIIDDETDDTDDDTDDDNDNVVVSVAKNNIPMTAKNIHNFILVGICSLYIIPRVIGTINVVSCINNAPWDAVV